MINNKFLSTVSSIAILLTISNNVLAATSNQTLNIGAIVADSAPGCTLEITGSLDMNLTVDESVAYNSGKASTPADIKVTCDTSYTIKMNAGDANVSSNGLRWMTHPDYSNKKIFYNICTNTDCNTNGYNGIWK